ncbi:MAG: hypothetical protein H8E46_09685 [FCB group bacterium]|nr:hypothetical protein [FCB group bacterium]
MSKQDKSSGVYGDLGEEMERSGDERFVRLEDDGDSIMGFFAGKPHSRYVYWNGTQYAEWKEGCGEKQNLRVSQNFIVCSVEDDELEIVGVKILEQGKRFFKTVMKRDAKFGIQNYLFEIQREGNKGDSDTTYSIDAEHKLTEKQKKELAKVKLLDLESFYSGGNSGSESAMDSATEDDDDGLISGKQKQDLVTLFKTTDDPENEGKKFCKKFGITKVAELPKSKLAKAVKYMEKLTGEEIDIEDDDDGVF